MRKGNAIFYSAILLTGANFLLRLSAMSFQVYLSSRIGPAGIGLLQLILSVTALSFTVGSAGVRTCAMYLSAEELGRNRPKRIYGILNGCYRYAALFGGLTAAALWYAAPWLASEWIGSPAAVPALRFYALFLPVKCLHGVLTGYFTAAERVGGMVLTAFLEQICSMLVTFLLLACWAGADTGRAAFSVVAGSCAATVLAYFVLSALRRKKLPGRRLAGKAPYRRIFQISLPLALADTLRSGLNTIEDLIIPRRLSLFSGTVDAMADYGIIRGMVFPVLMFPAAILLSLAELLVPEFSRCAARGSTNRVRYLAKQGLRVSLLFGLCAASLLFTAADALGERLYQNEQVGLLLRLYAPFVPMLYMDSIVDAMCKGLGQQNANARYNTLTSFLDVVFLWALLPRLGLNGYYFSFAVSHIVNFALSLRRLVLTSGIRLELPLRAVLCTVGACACAALLPAGGIRILVCLLVLLFSWLLAGVVSRDDAVWLRTLIGGR
ncbi:MAG: polysaccharide biosynthesis C-terminal domain-containing protein [Oscillospiraceae bacterium]|nr:polysaccharide biosynthesis C-terminal domain-containing protein [Oscillospiraceae bacterium]